MASPYLQPPPKSSQGSRAGMQGTAKRTDDRVSPLRCGGGWKHCRGMVKQGVVSVCGGHRSCSEPA